MKLPFPWFGGKSSVASLVWERFGNVQNYVEPFFGSGAVLLNRPHAPSTETVNDLDCLVANFWRALRHDPGAVAEHADNPVNEADQHARHLWLCSQVEFRERMKTEPEFYDTKIAGWWVWGQCIWIGAGWCSRQLPHLGDAGTGVHRKLPHLGDAGKGLNRQLPHLGDAGKGLNRQLPHLGNAGKGLNRQLPHLGDAGTGNIASDLTLGTRRGQLLAYMRELAERLRSVRVCCGDWTRVCGPSVTVKHGITGVFLDPPYADEAERTSNLYSQDSGDVAHAVREWAIEQGADPRARIALCGYEGEHAMPDAWECVRWKARGGYGSQGDNAGRENSARERIWFSPYCLRSTLFSELKGEVVETT
jgi:D12 class N6 adenine-specific DNA methyltransferase